MKTICISSYVLPPCAVIQSTAAAVPLSYNCTRLEKHGPGLTSGVYNQARNSFDVSRKGGRTFVLVRCSSRDEKGLENLNREEVINLLTEALNTLLRPENKQRLLEKLRQKRHHINRDWSDISQQYADVSQSEMQNETDTTDGRTFSGQPSTERKNSSTEALTGRSSKLDTIPPVLSQEQSRDVKIESQDVDTRTETSVTDIRSLKVLNVHSYVHNALRKSALRTWLQSRKIAD